MCEFETHTQTHISIHTHRTPEEPDTRSTPPIVSEWDSRSELQKCPQQPGPLSPLRACLSQICNTTTTTTSFLSQSVLRERISKLWGSSAGRRRGRCWPLRLMGGLGGGWHDSLFGSHAPWHAHVTLPQGNTSDSGGCTVHLLGWHKGA